MSPMSRNSVLEEFRVRRLAVIQEEIYSIVVEWEYIKIKSNQVYFRQTWPIKSYKRERDKRKNTTHYYSTLLLKHTQHAKFTKCEIHA